MKARQSILLVACLALFCLLGCEERVVRTRNSFIEPSHIARTQRESATRRKEKNFLDHTWDFLFGWTRHLDGDDQEPRKRRVKPVEFSPVMPGPAQPQTND